MELDVRIGTQSLSIPIDNPFRLDLDSIVGRIESFLASQDVSRQDLDFRGLLPKMVKGIAGCEGGCPADAKSFVSRGYTNFRLEYVEGGILQAAATTAGAKNLTLRMFPDF